MRRLRRSFFLPVLAFTLVTAACSDSQSERSSYVRNTLVEDNRMFLEREPELTAGKFRKMQSTLYNYFRGTAPQYLRDQTLALVPGVETSFGTHETSTILIVGDPHPENLGSFLGPDDRLRLEYNDFDGARFGPFHFDVRRLAVGFLIAAEFIGGDLVSEEEGRQWASAAVAAYAAEVARLANGGSPGELREGADNGVIVADLFRRARRDGAIAEELLEYTVIEDGRRKMFDGEIEGSTTEGVVGDEVRVTNRRQTRVVRDIFEDYSGRSAEQRRLRFKGASRRLGAGVASYPVKRWYVLSEGPTDDVEDDELLEIKEVLDPARIPGLALLRHRDWESNGERVVAAQLRMQTAADNDELLGFARSGAISFRVRHRTKYQKGIDVARIADEIRDGEWNASDVRELAEHAGRLLANAHHLGGGPGAPERRNASAILAAIGDGSAFSDETLDFATSYRAVVIQDYQLFGELMLEHGDLLGWGGLR